MNTPRLDTFGPFRIRRRAETVHLDGVRYATASYASWAMTDDYVGLAMRNAEFETLEDGGLYAEIPGFRGVWAVGGNAAAVREELREVLREWMEFGNSKNLDVPKIGL